MKVLVCGGRGYADRQHVFDELDSLHANLPITRLVHGAARGADQWAAEWADYRGIVQIRYPANWALHGLAAGPKRNATMLACEQPDLVVAFPGGAGTRDMVRRAARARRRVIAVQRSYEPVVIGRDGHVPDRWYF